MVPEDLKYTKEHEWIKVDGNVAAIGITDHAQSELGDIVYAELPEIGARLSQMQEFGVVESVKSVSNLYCPISGEVTEINAEVIKSPEIVNTDPYGKGWMIKIKTVNPSEADALLSSQEYKKLIGK